MLLPRSSVFRGAFRQPLRFVAFLALALLSAAPALRAATPTHTAQIIAAIARGDANVVRARATAYRTSILTELRDPAVAAELAAALTAFANSPAGIANPALASNFATGLGSVMLNLATASPQSATTLALAVSSITARPEVIAANPAAAANAAMYAAAVANTPAVIAANPGGAAQIAVSASIVAANPAAMAAFPIAAANIAASVSGVLTNQSVVDAAPALAATARANTVTTVANPAVANANVQTTVTIQNNLAAGAGIDTNARPNSPTGG